MQLSNRLEYIFLLTPVLIVRALVYIRFPSLYNIRSIILRNIVLIMGYQWYWEISNNEIYLQNGLGYLVERNETYITKYNDVIRVTGRSNDVIHRIYLPESQFKIDLVPGRLSSGRVTIYNLVNYGVCAEICGANHAFIPFKFVVTSN